MEQAWWSWNKRDREREIRNGTEKTEENILAVEKNREKKVTGHEREDRVVDVINTTQRLRMKILLRFT